jgi:RNA polymerase sigma factor (sigma-70 family)
MKNIRWRYRRQGARLRPKFSPRDRKSGMDTTGYRPEQSPEQTTVPTAVHAGTELALIGGVREGDPSAMGALYERHKDQGLRFARVLMSGTQEAEDVLHEAFTRAVSAIRNGHGPTSAFGPYLSTCIRSAASALWKKQAREKPAPAEDLDPGPIEDPALETALSVFEHEDIAAAMRSLPKRWRMVLWHAEVMGDPPRDIAPVLGIEPNAVSALLIRARAGLRAAYELQSIPSAPANAMGDFN